MGFNFPNSPTEGQTYTPVGGYQYVYTSGTWRVIENPQVRATAEARNRIVNGAMQISQEYGDTGVQTGLYPADQWNIASPIATMIGQRQSGAPSGNSYVQTYVVTAKPSLAAGDYWFLRQPIEGIRVKDFLYGTANAKQSVMRFSAWSTYGGTFSFALHNSASDRAFLAPFILPVATWTTFTIVIPGDTTGTWLKDTGVGLYLDFGFATGANYAGGVAGWQAGNKIQIAGNTNGAATANSAFYIADVGLYLDANSTGLAPPWQMPDEAQELAACQRYYCRQPCAAIVSNTTPYYGMSTVFFPVTMRIAPAVTNVNAGAIASATVIGDYISSTTGGYFQIQANSAHGNITGRVNAYSARM